MADKSAQGNFKILIADDDGTHSRRLLDFLKERGFLAEHVTSGRTAKDRIREWRPTFVIADLTLPEVNAPQLLDWVKSGELGDYKPKVIVTSSHNSVANIKSSIRAGAVDFVVKPYKPDDVLTRLVFHIQNKRELIVQKDKGPQAEGADIYLHLLDIVMREALSGHTRDEILWNVAKMIAITLSAVRCSAVMISEDLQSGTVMASSDDKNAKGFQLDMNKYPEMLHVMNTEKAVIIEDLAYDPMLAKIKDLVKGISFNSMIIAPVRRNAQMWGVISARMDTKHSKFNDRDIRFVQLVAQVMSLTLSTNMSLPHEFFKDPKSA